MTSNLNHFVSSNLNQMNKVENENWHEKACIEESGLPPLVIAISHCSSALQLNPTEQPISIQLTLCFWL